MSNKVWRVHLAADGNNPRGFCLERSVVGVGWSVKAEGHVDAQVYEELARAAYPGSRGWSMAWNAIYRHMQLGDLCWSRTLDGVYYIARVTSGWRYENTPDHIAADIVNVRNAEWHLVGAADQVPGTVLRYFIRGPAIRSIADATTVAATKALFNRVSGTIAYKLELKCTDIFQLLTPWDVENLVALYLQIRHGYCLLPRTADSTAPMYEFVLTHHDGRRAAAQVKSGNVQLDAREYESVAKRFAEFFLCSTAGSYIRCHSDKIRYIEPDVLRAFAYDERRAMPAPIQAAMDLEAELLASDESAR